MEDKLHTSNRMGSAAGELTTFMELLSPALDGGQVCNKPPRSSLSPLESWRSIKPIDDLPLWRTVGETKTATVGSPKPPSCLKQPPSIVPKKPSTLISSQSMWTSVHGGFVRSCAASSMGRRCSPVYTGCKISPLTQDTSFPPSKVVPSFPPSKAVPSFPPSKVVPSFCLLYTSDAADE